MHDDAVFRAIRLSMLPRDDASCRALHDSVEKILVFVGEIQSLDADDCSGERGRVNVFRDDRVTVPGGLFLEPMLDRAPARFKRWFLSKKIL